MNTQTWSIVILCYNEVATIRRVVKNSLDVLNVISAPFHELIIVDDGSQDGSTELIEQFSRQYPNVRAIFHPTNQGIGPSLRDGYRAATAENVVAIPADGQFNVRELIPHAWVPPRTILAFYRSENQSYSPFRNALSWANKWINRCLLGCDMKDVNWATVYKTDALHELDLKLTSSLVESEICAKMVARGFRIFEVQSVYHRRIAGVSKGGSWKTVLQAARETVKLLRVVSQFRHGLGAR